MNTTTDKATTGYRITRDHAGVRNGRASSLFEYFGDANRAAMAACVQRDRPVRVWASDGQFIVEYIPINGRAQVGQVGTPSESPR